MELKETIEKADTRGTDLKKVVTDIIEVASEVIGLAASPSTLWIAVLWNCNGGRGFNGYVVLENDRARVP